MPNQATNTLPGAMALAEQELNIFQASASTNLQQKLILKEAAWFTEKSQALNRTWVRHNITCFNG